MAKDGRPAKRRALSCAGTMTCSCYRLATRLRLRAYRTALCTALAGAADACSGPSVLTTAGPIANSNRIILLDSVALMLVIVVPTIVGALWFAWWFRAGNARARYRPDFVFSGRIELIVWSIPFLVILFLGGVIWIGSHELDPYKAIKSPVRPLEVQVVSLDWKWLFIYPEQGVASVNQLLIPAGRPVHFSLTSASVMNAFFIPQLGSMIYTMNGMVTQLNLRADHAGSFYGQSAMFSGDGFSDMHFVATAVPADQFAHWITSTAGHGPLLNSGSYAQLARQGTSRPLVFGTVQPDLFRAVASGTVKPASGPTRGMPNPQTKPSQAPGTGDFNMANPVQQAHTKES